MGTAYNMKSYPLGAIPPDSYFSQSVFLDDKFVLAAPETPFSPELKKALLDWQFKEVFSDGEQGKNNVSMSSGISTEGLEHSFKNDGEKLKIAEEFYAAFLKYTEQLFARLLARKSVEFNSTAEDIKAFCGTIQENQRYVLRILQTTNPPADQDYLPSHAVRSTIIAVIIGSALKLPNHRLIELGAAALFHEAGMLELPPQITLSKRPLSPLERNAILTHPIRGYKLLSALNFPMAVNAAALEHHERENGSGYPRKLSSGQISLYSKIIAVACSWEALSVSRPHREAKNGNMGMVELLRNEGKQYDDTVIRALVYSLSIYPIGLYVLLSNGKRAQVVDVNPRNPRFPIVQMLEEFSEGGKKKIVATSETGDGIFIISSLTREEAGV
ncbi:phosphohydrolase [Spirochaetia bacterium]|nr:phosphohydrolase [Spirochaetia bacterium]